MNIYNFLVSPDIAAHCELIGHIFNPLEMALIIAWSGKTLTEKHAAWREIIAEYHDMPIPDSLNFKGQGSLREYLRALIAQEEDVLKDFLTTCENEVYHVSVCQSGRNGKSQSVGNCFSTFSKAWEACKKWDWAKDNIAYAAVSKKMIDSGEGVSVSVNADCEILSVFCYNSPKYKHRLLDDLSQIPFLLPVPFVKGDLVDFYNGRVGVIKSISNNPEIGDASDMLAECYVFDDDYGKFISDCFPYSLLDLQYYKGELKGQERFLKHLSKYIKENDDSIDWLIHVFSTITAQAEFERPTPYFDIDERNSRQIEHQ